MLILRYRDQPKRLVFMDRLGLLLKDPLMVAMNRTMAEWQKKAKEDERRKKQ